MPCRCYADGNPRALPLLLGVNDTGMTVAMCAGMAFNVRYTIFAVQVGQECWAGTLCVPVVLSQHQLCAAC